VFFIAIKEGDEEW